MTGFDRFAATTEMELDSFRCITCDVQFINALDALTHINNTHLTDDYQATLLEQTEDEIEIDQNREIDNSGWFSF